MIFSLKKLTAAHIYVDIKKLNYPCLCLCLGFSQITLITPFLLMILHLSQIFFTDGLTFISILPFFNSYLALHVIRPFDRSYGDNSNLTLSPGRIFI